MADYISPPRIQFIGNKMAALGLLAERVPAQSSSSEKTKMASFHDTGVFTKVGRMLKMVTLYTRCCGEAVQKHSEGERLRIICVNEVAETETMVEIVAEPEKVVEVVDKPEAVVEIFEEKKGGEAFGTEVVNGTAAGTIDGKIYVKYVAETEAVVEVVADPKTDKPEKPNGTDKKDPKPGIKLNGKKIRWQRMPAKRGLLHAIIPDINHRTFREFSLPRWICRDMKTQDHGSGAFKPDETDDWRKVPAGDLGGPGDEGPGGHVGHEGTGDEKCQECLKLKNWVCELIQESSEETNRHIFKLSGLNFGDEGYDSVFARAQESLDKTEKYVRWRDMKIWSFEHLEKGQEKAGNHGEEGQEDIGDGLHLNCGEGMV